MFLSTVKLCLMTPAPQCPGENHHPAVTITHSFYSSPLDTTDWYPKCWWNWWLLCESQCHVCSVLAAKDGRKKKERERENKVAGRLLWHFHPHGSAGRRKISAWTFACVQRRWAPGRQPVCKPGQTLRQSNEASNKLCTAQLFWIFPCPAPCVHGVIALTESSSLFTLFKFWIAQTQQPVQDILMF